MDQQHQRPGRRLRQHRPADPSGRFTYFTVPNKDEAWDITNGPGGLWFTDIQGEVGGGGAIGPITAW